MCPERSFVSAEIPKTAVIGAGGFLGSRLLPAMRALHPDAVGTVHRDVTPSLALLDLGRPDFGSIALADSGHRAAIICAGISSIARCENAPLETRAVNVDGTANLARRLCGEGVLPVVFSSDYVFGGDAAPYAEYAPMAPLNEYGRQKAEVEERLRAMAPEAHLIVRLSKVFSLWADDGTLLDDMAKRLLQGEYPAASDQWFCPTLVDDLVQAVLLLLGMGVRGTVNLCSPAGWNRHEMALLMADSLGVPRGRVRRISIDDLADGVHRPHDIRMIPSRLFEENGLGFTPIESSIGRIAAGKTQRRQ